MDTLLSQLPPWFIVVAIIILAGFAAYLVVHSLREGREITFWPPRIGPRVLREEGNKGEADKGSESGEKTPRVVSPSEPIGMIRVTSGPWSLRSFDPADAEIVFWSRR